MSAASAGLDPPYAEVMPSEVVLHLRRYEPWTWDDLQVIPDEEHHHYELIEGQIVVSPSPDLRHQTIVGNLFMALRAVAPREFQVVVSPFDYVPAIDTTLQPDVLVLRRGTSEFQRTVAPPVLAVEVLSRRTRTFDLTAKREIYARTGVAHHWVIDPEVPSIVALRLGSDGEYREVGRADGAERLTLSEPFAVELTPVHLLDD